MDRLLKRSCVLLIVWAFAGCRGEFAEYDPNDSAFTGTEARDRIGETLPQSSTDFYLFDGGTFNGSIKYFAFTCATVDDCWKAVAALGGPNRNEFTPSIRSDYAVNTHGPAFYSPEMQTPLWEISVDAEGFSWEIAREDRRMEFWAIDVEAKRVFYHLESGGFPTDPPAEEFRRTTGQRDENATD